MNNDTIQAPFMHGYLARGARFKRPVVTPGTPLPPRDTFKGMPDLLAVYDEHKALSDAMRTHNAAEAHANRSAADADQAHARALREAMGRGEDTTTMPNPADAHRADARHHAALAAEAKAGATDAGYRLGQILHDNAATLIERADKGLEKSAANLAASVDALSAAWAAQSEAFNLRRMLSGALYLGGATGTHRPGSALPPDVAAALATLRDHANDLAKLRSDEANVRDFREADAKAAAANEAAVSSVRR